MQTSQQWQGECKCLARASASAAKSVTPGKGVSDSCLLNRKRGEDALLCKNIDEGRGQTKVCKGRTGVHGGISICKGPQIPLCTHGRTRSAQPNYRVPCGKDRAKSIFLDLLRKHHLDCCFTGAIILAPYTFQHIIQSDQGVCHSVLLLHN